MTARALHGWRLRALIVAGLVALYAVTGFFIVPPIARAQLVKLVRTKMHREATIARVTFNPFTFAATIEGLAIKDRDGAPLVAAKRIAANFQLSGIFRRAWRFKEVSIDEPSFEARILADGKPSVADLFEPQPGAPPPPPQKKKGGLPRLIVDRFVMQRGRAAYTDESRTPPFTQAFEPLDVDVHELITIPEERGEHTLTIGLGEGATIRWSGRQTVDPLHLEGHLEVIGIRLPRVWEFALPEHPLEIAEGMADVKLDYDVRKTGDEPVKAALHGASVTGRGIVARPRGGTESWLEVPSIEVAGIEAAWPERRVTVSAVRVTDPKGLVRRTEDKELNWRAAVPPASNKSETETGGSAPKVTARIDEVALTGGRVLIDDRGVVPAVETVLDGIEVKVSGVSTDLAAPLKLQVETSINTTAKATVSGTLVPKPVSVELDVALEDLDLTPFQSYAVRLPGADYRSGKASASGHLSVSDKKPALDFKGQGAVTELQIAGAGEDKLVAWDRAEAAGVRVTRSPDHVRVERITVHHAFVKLRIDKQGKINLSKLRQPDKAQSAPPPDAEAPPSEDTAAAGEEAEAPPPPEPPPSAKPSQTEPPESPAAAAKGVPPPLALDIGRIVLKDAEADYTDESLILPFGTRIHSLNGDLRDITTTGAAPARLAVEGRVADTGYVKSDGTLRIVDPFASTDVKVIFRNVAMQDLTPYSAQFAGYSIQKGVLDVDVRYRVENRRLVGDHHVVAKDLVLGPKVEGSKAPPLPLRLAVALLKDKDGNIDLELPIEGMVDSPKFAYKVVLWQAVKTILGNIVKAPFRAIGRLFGADKEDLELVAFAAGQSELPAPEREMLEKMGTELAQKGGISLEIEGRFDPAADAAALCNARLEEKIDAKRTPDATLDSILESLYTETFGAEKLEAVRAEFQPVPPGTAGAAAESAPAKPEKPKKTKKGAPPPPPAPAREGFDAPGFYDRLRKDLLESEKIDEAELAELARARGQAIASALTSTGGLDPSRVAVTDPAPAKRKKKASSDMVASEMTMNAKD